MADGVADEEVVVNDSFEEPEDPPSSDVVEMEANDAPSDVVHAWRNVHHPRRVVKDGRLPAA